MKIIPESITNDMTTLGLLYTAQNSLTNEQGLTVEIAVAGDNEMGGMMLAFDSPNSLSHSAGDFDYELYLRSTDPFPTSIEHLFDNTYTLTTSVLLEGLEPKSFTCVYDFDTAKGLPESMYQAYAYLRTGLDMPLERRLEYFGGIVSDLPLNGGFDMFLDGDANTMGGFFDVEKALAHDLKAQQLIAY